MATIVAIIIAVTYVALTDGGPTHVVVCIAAVCWTLIRTALGANRSPNGC